MDDLIVHADIALTDDVRVVVLQQTIGGCPRRSGRPVRAVRLHGGQRPEPDCDGGSEAGWNRILRTFQIPATRARRNVKFVVLNNPCTGDTGYQGEQHNDPTRPSSDCRTQATGANQVRATERQLLTSRPRVDGATRVD